MGERGTVIIILTQKIEAKNNLKKIELIVVEINLLIYIHIYTTRIIKHF